MSKIYSGSSQRAPAGASTTIAPSPGKLWGFIVSSTNATGATIILYDNTAASGTVLMQIIITANNSPYAVNFPDYRPLKFSTGLTVTCPANTELIAIVEY